MKTAVALSALVAAAAANLDIVTLNVQSGNYITEADATIVLPTAQSPQTGDAALWSAIMMDGQDFLQGVTQNSKDPYWCQNMSSDEWCNMAYTLVGSDATTGDPVVASPGQKVRTHYKLNTSTQLWDQNVYIDGKLVSTVNTSKGQKGTIFYISLECAGGGSCGEVGAHEWENVSVTLAQADQSFGQEGGNWQYGATGGEMSSSDGKVWKFSTLKVPAMNPQ